MMRNFVMFTVVVVMCLFVSIEAGRRKKSCNVDGETYQHGEIWYDTDEKGETNVCVISTCRNGKRKYLFHQCKNEDGKCVKKGKIQVNSTTCVRHKCVIREDNEFMKAIKRDCIEDIDVQIGHCVKPGRPVFEKSIFAQELLIMCRCKSDTEEFRTVNCKIPSEEEEDALFPDGSRFDV